MGWDAASNRKTLYIHPSPENLIGLDRFQLIRITETICTDKACRYPQLTLRIFLHVIVGLDKNGLIYINAKQLAKTLGVNYNTVLKCLKYLRQIDLIRLER